MMNQHQSHPYLPTAPPLAPRQVVHSSEGNQRSWWRHPVVGYVVTFPIIAASIGVRLLGEALLQDFYVPTSFLLIALLVVALLWGTRPALFLLVLSVVVLVFFVIFPGVGHMRAPLSWDFLFDLLPFFLAGLVIAVLTGQLERARQCAKRTAGEIQEHAHELAMVNQELKQADALKDQFLSMASHELKTPLTSMHGLVQLSLRRLDKQQRKEPEMLLTREVLTKVDQQNKRLIDLVHDLLDINSLRSGKMPLEMSLCDLNTIGTEVVEEQRLLSGRSIVLILPASPVEIRGDAMRFSQVFTNLISNALKYSPEECEVIVRVEREEQKQTALVSVHDYGKGISEDQLQTIFEPFYRTPDVRSSEVSGTGLGLSICYEIIMRHQGRIWCESQPECGSTFFVEVPLSSQL